MTVKSAVSAAQQGDTSQPLLALPAAALAWRVPRLRPGIWLRGPPAGHARQPDRSMMITNEHVKAGTSHPDGRRQPMWTSSARVAVITSASPSFIRTLVGHFTAEIRKPVFGTREVILLCVSSNCVHFFFLQTLKCSVPSLRAHELSVLFESRPRGKTVSVCNPHK